jgi:hypothetical protein
MSTTAVLTLLTQIAGNLPAAISTGQQVIQLVNESYRQLNDAFGDREATREEIEALVARIVANSAAIQALD